MSCEGRALWGDAGSSEAGAVDGATVEDILIRVHSKRGAKRIYKLFSNNCKTSAHQFPLRTRCPPLQALSLVTLQVHFKNC